MKLNVNIFTKTVCEKISHSSFIPQPKSYLVLSTVYVKVRYNRYIFKDNSVKKYKKEEKERRRKREKRKTNVALALDRPVFKLHFATMLSVLFFSSAI